MQHRHETVKVWPEDWQRLVRIKAETGETFVRILARLIRAEAAKIEQQKKQ
jgi:hypothetical protein